MDTLNMLVNQIEEQNNQEHNLDMNPTLVLMFGLFHIDNNSFVLSCFENIQENIQYMSQKKEQNVNQLDNLQYPDRW